MDHNVDDGGWVDRVSYGPLIHQKKVVGSINQLTRYMDTPSIHKVWCSAPNDGMETNGWK